MLTLQDILKVNNITMDRLLSSVQDSDIQILCKELLSYIDPCFDLYFVSGTVRNGLYYHYFKKNLPQRDFDVVVFGNHQYLVEALQNNGWINDTHVAKHNGVILYKPKPSVTAPQACFADCMYLDIIFAEPETTILQNLQQHANFTINGGALALPYILSPNRIEHIITLPTTLSDITYKQLILNDKNDPRSLFACLRFMSQGFLPPPALDIQLMLTNIHRLSQDKFTRNFQKLLEYVGGKEKVYDLTHQLGIPQSVRDGL